MKVSANFPGIIAGFIHALPVFLVAKYFGLPAGLALATFAVMAYLNKLNSKRGEANAEE